MNRNQAREKIAKLLALAQSDNANEANAALLAARRLMAQYKLNERDIEQGKPKELRTVAYEDATYSGIRNGWFSLLSRVIAEHHCCADVKLARKGSTVGKIGFVGLDDDPDIACTIFSYALDHIKRRTAQERDELCRILRDKIKANAAAKDFAFNYAAGFASGLKKQYEEQDSAASEETALVLVKPKEVSDYERGLARCTVKTVVPSYNQDARARGYADGYKFNPTPQIKAQRQTKAISD